MHRLHHEMESRIEKLLGIFRVEVPNELGRVFEVGKQDGDVLALAFQRRARGEDFLSEI
jgi:hypothetical protein